MTETQFLNLASDVARVAGEFQEVEETPLPTSLKEASEQRFELVSTAYNVGVLEYARHVQAQDRGRVVRFRDAIKAMGEYEEELVDALVQNSDDLLWGKLSGLWSALKFLANNQRSIWEILLLAIPVSIGDDTSLRESKGWEFTSSIVHFAVKHFVIIATVATLGVAVGKMVKHRDSAISKLRKRALPQSKGPRFRRRKVARL